MKPNKEGESSKVKVKVRINLNGIFTVSSASLIEKREPTQQEKEEEDQQMKEQESKEQDSKKNKIDQEAEAKEPPAPEVSDVFFFSIWVVFAFKIYHLFLTSLSSLTLVWFLHNWDPSLMIFGKRYVKKASLSFR